MKKSYLTKMLLIVAALATSFAVNGQARGKYPLIMPFDCDTVFQKDGIWYGRPYYDLTYCHYGPNEIRVIAPWQAVDDETWYSTPIEERSEERYSGDIYVPDYVDFDGVRYTVTMVSSRVFEGADSLTSLRIPPIRELTQATFDNTRRLKSLVINGDVCGGEHAFHGSGIKELTLTAPYFRDKTTWVDEEFDGLGLDLLKVERCDNLTLGCATAVDLCLEVEGCDYLCLYFPFSHHYAKNGPYWAPKYIVWHGVEPPVVEIDSEFKYLRPDEWEEQCKLKNTVLFVPDESIELYRDKFFWKDFYSIHGISELARVDEILAEVGTISIDRPTDFTVEGNQLILSGGGEHRMECYTFMGVCLDRRICGEGAVTLPAGTDIVVVDGISRKVIVR